jgi:hypothetical protein
MLLSKSLEASHPYYSLNPARPVLLMYLLY